MACSVYKGVQRAGLERRCGSFKDGIFIMRCEVVRGQVIVTDPLNRQYYRSEAIPELDGYVVQEITCLRSAQSGQLVVTLGGFYADSSYQQALTIATDYAIAEPVDHEAFVAGVR